MLLLAVVVGVCSGRGPTQYVGESGQELARRMDRTDADHGAAPDRALTSAPVADATQSEEDRRMRKSEQEQNRGAGLKVGMAAALCLTVACATTPQPRQHYRLPAEECPPGAAEAMKELGWKPENPYHMTFQKPGSGKAPQDMPIKEGPVVLYGESAGEPVGEATGRLYFDFDAGRIYGRLTQFKHKDGRVRPICMTVHDNKDAWLRKQGAFMKHGTTRKNVLIFANVVVSTAERFEEIIGGYPGQEKEDPMAPFREMESR